MQLWKEERNKEKRQTAVKEEVPKRGIIKRRLIIAKEDTLQYEVN
jgi:hypothetical protein